MKELDLLFSGTGDVRGFEFKQLYIAKEAYMYEVFSPDISETYYEVFERRESKESITMMQGTQVIFPAKVNYPNSKAFGNWAFCFKNEEKAKEKFDELIIEIQNKKKNEKTN